MQPVSQPVSQRAAPRAVHSIDHFAFSVPDLAEAERFYVDFGLDVQRQDGSRLTLRAHGQPHAWATLSQAPGAKQLQYLRWGIYAEDEAFFARQAADLGLAVGPHPAGDGRGLWLRGPDGLAQPDSAVWRSLLAFVLIPAPEPPRCLAPPRCTWCTTRSARPFAATG